MKILVVSQYFPPEPGAASNRVLSFVEALANRGHEVTVLCEFPHYPAGRLAPQDRWRLFRREQSGSYQVVRTFVLAFSRMGNIRRMLCYLSFAFSSFWAILFMRRRDIVLASSPPIFFVFGAMVAAKLKGSKFVADIRDIWPDAAYEFGAISNRRMLRLGGLLERAIYRAAAAILTISPGAASVIAARGGKGKTHVIYNGAREEILKWSGETEALRKQLGWGNRTVITYAGIIGLGQNLRALVPEIAGFQRPDVLFVFIGEGPQKEDIARDIGRLGIQNVKIYDGVPFNEVIAYLYSSDIMLVVLRERDFFKNVIPSKFFDSLAAGKPVVTNADGELREIMEKYDVGLYFSLRTPGSFAAAVNALCDSPQRRQLMGENGRTLVRTRFLRTRLAQEAAEILEGLAGQGARGATRKLAE